MRRIPAILSLATLLMACLLYAPSFAAEGGQTADTLASEEAADEPSPFMTSEEAWEQALEQASFTLSPEGQAVETPSGWAQLYEYPHKIIISDMKEDVPLFSLFMSRHKGKKPEAFMKSLSAANKGSAPKLNAEGTYEYSFTTPEGSKTTVYLLYKGDFFVIATMYGHSEMQTRMMRRLVHECIHLE